MHSITIYLILLCLTQQSLCASSTNKAESTLRQIAEIEKENHDMLNEITQLRADINQYDESILHATSESKRLQMEQNTLRERITKMATEEQVFLAQKQRADTVKRKMEKDMNTMMTRIEEINAEDLRMEYDQRKRLERLFISRFLWQIEIKTTEEQKELQQLIEMGGVLASVATVYLSGGSSLLFGSSLKWYLQSKIQNTVIDFCARQAVSNIPRILFYAGGTLANELKIHGSRHAELLLQSTVEHVKQIDQMLRDYRADCPQLYDAVVKELGTQEGLKNWMKDKNNVRIHNAYVLEIQKTIKTDSMLAQRKRVSSILQIE